MLLTSVLSVAGTSHLCNRIADLIPNSPVSLARKRLEEQRFDDSFGGLICVVPERLF